MIFKKNKINNILKNIKREKIEKSNWINCFDRLKKDFNLNIAVSLFCSVVKDKLGIELYNEQIAAAILLHNGNIIEMGTGEGKTLSAVLASFLNFLNHKKTYVITNNDYLVIRDASLSNSVLSEFGIKIGYVVDGVMGFRRKDVYEYCDVIYTRIDLIIFDYLRTKNSLDKKRDIVNVFDSIIIDEVDTVIIDQATHPLYLTGSKNETKVDYFKINRFSSELKEVDDYTLNKRKMDAFLTDSGYLKLEEFAYKNKWIKNKSELYSPENNVIIQALKNAIVANKLLVINEDYVVKNNKIMVIDSKTGRVSETRSFEYGLEQALQTLNKIKITQIPNIISMTTIQSFLKEFLSVSGMSGTVIESKKEIADIYGLDVFKIPPHKAPKKIVYSDLIFGSKDLKLNYLIDKVVEINKTGQPILIGTLSVEDSEQIALKLRDRGLAVNLLNAVNHAHESEIIKNAGLFGAITVATNMAGRGSDIVLGGGADWKRVNDLGGLFVIGYERGLSRRFDNQLAGRCGRQGDNGSVLFMNSLDDKLIQTFGGDKMEKMFSVFKIKNDAVSSKSMDKYILRLQDMVEAKNYSIRKELSLYDSINKELRDIYFDFRSDIKNKDIIKFIKNLLNKKVSSIVDGKINYSTSWDTINVDEIVNINLFFDGSDLEIKELLNNDDVDLINEKMKSIISKNIEKYIQKMTDKYHDFFGKIIRDKVLNYLSVQWGLIVENLDKYEREAMISKSLNKIPEQEYRDLIFSEYNKLLSDLNDFSFNLLKDIQFEISSEYKISLSSDWLNKSLKDGITLGYLANSSVGV